MLVELNIYPDGRMDPYNCAKYLGMTVNSLATFRSQGIGPKFIKFHNKIFYYKNDVDDWLQSFPRKVMTKNSNKNGETIGIND